MTVNFNELFKKAQEAKAKLEASAPDQNIQEKYRASQSATPQQRYYLDLCKIHNVEPVDLSKTRGFELYNLIEELKAKPTPPSPAQLQKIDQMVEELIEMGAKIKPFSAEFKARLTGGREGTASGLLQTLYNKKQEYDHIAPLTPRQADTLADWFWCPDIPYENYDVEKKIYLNDESVQAKLNDPSTKPWRFMTKDEFIAELNAKVVRSTAKLMIAKYQSVYYEWNKTRITKFQIQTIRKIEAELANIEAPKKVEEATMFDFDDDGNLIDNSVEFSQRSLKDEYNPNAYDGLEESQLRQMSYEDADLYIRALKAERDDKKLVRFPETQDSSQQNLQDKHSHRSDQNQMGRAKDESDARVREYTALNDLIYKLEAVLGQEDENLHDLIKETVLDEGSKRNEEAVQAIKEFMYSTLDTRSAEHIDKSIGSLFTMAQESLIATQIVEIIQLEIKEMRENGEEFDADLQLA